MVHMDLMDRMVLTVLMVRVSIMALMDLGVHMVCGPMDLMGIIGPMDGDFGDLDGEIGCKIKDLFLKEKEKERRLIVEKK
jgi:hypothetical protein